MTSEPTHSAYLLICVHATRRTRKAADPGTTETRCTRCRATILVNPRSTAFARQHGITLYPICTMCTMTTAEPDELVGDVMTVPGTAEMLEADGYPDGEAEIARRAGLTLREFAAQSLRSTIGGQG